MLKYAKYEIRGTYRYILGVLALVLILTTALYAYFNRVDSTGEVSVLGGMFTVLSVLILFGTALATFLYIVGSFRKELYEDRGYLTFTLPLTGNQIVGSKLIVASLWFIVLGAAIGLYNIIMILIFVPIEIDVNILEMLSRLFDFASIRNILFLVLSFILNIVNMLVIIYFSMAISRVTFRNKRVGSLWFIIFLVLSGVMALGAVKIAQLFPYYLDLNTFKIGSVDKLSQFYLEFDNSIVLSIDTSTFITNIAGLLYMIVTTVLLFLGTGYLIDRKIDL
ncbi:MAG: hypothetical protein GXZ06_01210 [Tissierellia bacterium]|nr:hypothetical protein [Tissierellia bacterium]